MANHARTAPVCLALPPGPKGTMLFGNLGAMKRDPLGFLQRTVREHGDVVRLKIIVETFLLNHPDHIRHVLQDNHTNYHKAKRTSIIKPLVGDGLLTSEGDFWKRQRRLAQPAFHRERLAALGDLMTAAAADTVDRWEGPAGSGVAIDVSAEMMRLTLRIVGEALFGVNLDSAASEVGEALTAALTTINSRFNRIFTLAWLPTPENIRFKRAMATLNGLVSGIIAERRRLPAGRQDRGDLLSMLMAARDADTGEAMDDRQLRDEVMTMLLAGHETTANNLAWTFLLLDRHPEIADDLRGKLCTAFGARQPTMAELPTVPELAATVQEGLRLYPPAWLFARTPVADDEIGGYRIPGGSTVFISPYVTHRDPRFWPNPENFDPSRFIASGACSAFGGGGRAQRGTFIPFAAGPRQCIGNMFALVEAQLILATVVRRFRLRLAPGARIEPEPSVTLRPKYGMPMTLERI